MITPFLINNHLVDLIMTIILGLIILICVNQVSRTRITINLSFILALLMLVCYIDILIMGRSKDILICYFAILTVFLAFMTISVISSVARHQEITINTLLGAICGYLLIGFTWCYLYLTIAHINPLAFSYQMEGTLRDNIQHFIYFSYITLTTVGYGDIVPKTDLTRAFTWLEAATGQIYLAVWISQLVAIHIAQRLNKKKS